MEEGSTSSRDGDATLRDEEDVDSLFEWDLESDRHMDDSDADEADEEDEADEADESTFSAIQDVAAQPVPDPSKWKGRGWRKKAASSWTMTTLETRVRRLCGGAPQTRTRQERTSVCAGS